MNSPATDVKTVMSTARTIRRFTDRLVGPVRRRPLSEVAFLDRRGERAELAPVP
jgi:hypothetical protein